MKRRVVVVSNVIALFLFCGMTVAGAWVNKPTTLASTDTVGEIPILEYHDTAYVPNWRYAMMPGQFADEMKYLKAHDFHTITLRQVYEAYQYGVPLPSRPIVLTFDDGHVSNYTMAFPILKKYGFVATEFEVTQAIGRKGFLSADNLVSMAASGVFDIASHSVTHRRLTQLKPAEIDHEVQQSKQTLESILGRPIQFFCYPYGEYNSGVVEAVRKAGYILAVTVHQGYTNPAVDGPLTLKRIAILEGLSLDDFAMKLSRSLVPSD